jgi:hypothetical protein
MLLAPHLGPLHAHLRTGPLVINPALLESLECTRPPSFSVFPRAFTPLRSPEGGGRLKKEKGGGKGSREETRGLKIIIAIITGPPSWLEPLPPFSVSAPPLRGPRAPVVT